MGKTLKKKTLAKPIAKSAPDKKLSAKKPATKRVTKTPRIKLLPDDPIRLAALRAAQYAIEKKGEAVLLLDLRGITSMTDFFVIATGTSDRQVKAIAENVIAEMRDSEGIPAWHSEGWEKLDWVLIDFVDFVVHVFQTEARKYYSLERLWGDAPVIAVEDTAKPKSRKRVAKTPTEAARKPRAKPAVRVISER
jgi:ribosome-associated protein